MYNFDLTLIPDVVFYYSVDRISGVIVVHIFKKDNNTQKTKYKKHKKTLECVLKDISYCLLI